MGSPRVQTTKLLWGIASLPIAALLAAIIAYHPIRVRNLGVKKEEWETPKALVIIAVAGVIVGTLVNIERLMALALFGFGSFIRFRTPVKNPKETAIIFFVAGLGCMCGFQQFEFALAATAFLFVLIWILDRRTSGNLERITLILKGLGTESQIASKGYKERLEASGVEVVSSKVSLRKGNVTLLLNKELRMTTDDIEQIIFKDDDLPRPRSVEWIKE